MNHVKFLQQLDELFELDPGTLQTSDEIEKISGWSSLTFLGLLALLDEEYGVAARPDAILACATLSDLIAYLERSLAGERSAA